MTLPVGLQTVTVTDTRQHPDGSPVTGRLVLRPEVPIISIPGQDVIVMGDSTARWVDGTATLTVLAADADGITPAGWTYRVYEYPDDAQPRDYPVLLTADLGTVDLADLAPVDPTVGEYVTVPGPEGPQGPKGDTGDTGATGQTGATGPQPSLGAAGAGATIALRSNDASTTNSRTPTAHKTSHATGGSDALTAADIGAYAASDGTVLEQLRSDMPSDQNLLAWTYDPNQAGHVTAQSNAGVAGRITLVRLIVRKQITWSNIWAGLSGIDAAAVLANCYLGVYDAAGTLNGVTADISALLMTNPVAKPFALAAPFTAAPGVYLIALLLNGTWATNSLTFKASGAGVSVNAGLTAPNLRYSNMLTAQTSLPGTLTLSGQTTTIITTGWGSQWYGVS